MTRACVESLRTATELSPCKLDEMLAGAQERSQLAAKAGQNEFVRFVLLLGAMELHGARLECLQNITTHPPPLRISDEAVTDEQNWPLPSGRTCLTPTRIAATPTSHRRAIPSSRLVARSLVAVARLEALSRVRVTTRSLRARVPTIPRSPRHRALPRCIWPRVAQQEWPTKPLRSGCVIRTIAYFPNGAKEAHNVRYAHAHTRTRTRTRTRTLIMTRTARALGRP